MEVAGAGPTPAAEIAPLLYRSGEAAYDAYVGGEQRALRAITEALARPGTSASRDVVSLATIDGQVAGLLVAFPSDQTATRSRRFLLVAARFAPPRLLPRLVRLYLAGRRGSPAAEPNTFYVDALATGARFRRRGVARLLLDHADRQARDRGLKAVTLDTSSDNLAAQRLYESSGFERVGVTGSAILYRKPLTPPAP